MRIIEKLLFLAFLVTVFGVAASQVASFDIFWQLQSGKFMLEAGRILRHDTFTLAADVPRWEHCWLHDVIAYGAYRLGGYPAIGLLKAAVLAATALVLALAARARGASMQALLIVLPPLFLLSWPLWLERPQIWTFLLFALFLLILELFAARGGRVVYLLAPLLVLWVNLHGGFMLAIPVVGAFLAGEAVAALGKKAEVRGGGWRHLALALALLAPALFLSPYGAEPLRSLLEAGSLGRGGIYSHNLDWRPTPFKLYPEFYYAMAAAAAIVLCGWRRLRLRDLLLLGGLGFMGVKFFRHTPFFFFAAAALLPAYLDQAAAPLLARLRGRGAVCLRTLALTLALLLAFWFARPAYRTYGVFDLGLENWRLPVRAAEYVRTNGLPGNLYHSFQVGGYLEWRLYPDYLVFWDGRATSEELMDDGWGVAHGGGKWQDILAGRGVNTVITEACSFEDGRPLPLVERLKADRGWALVAVEDAFLVFVRRSAAAPPWLAEHELASVRVDDGILNAARQIVRENPRAAMAYQQMAYIYLQRRDFRNAFDAIVAFRRTSPLRDSQLDGYYDVLNPMYGGK